MKSATMLPDKKSNTSIEITIVFVLFFLWIKYLETTWVGPFQLRIVGWDYFAHLMMFAFPVVVTISMGRSLKSIGFDLDNWRNRDMRKVARFAVLELTVIWAALVLIPHLLNGERPHLIQPPGHFAEGMALPGATSKYIGWAITVIFTTIFCGLGEEVFFRGYIQGRLNSAFTGRISIRGVSFGWGLIFSSIAFGLGHGIANFSPFGDNPLSFRLDAIETCATAAEGLFFGLLYEKSGGIWLPAILHGFIGLFFGAVIFP